MKSGVLAQMDPNKPNNQTIAQRPFLITFSGIDGAGKTTQIEFLTSSLQEQGLRVLRLSFWDDVAVWSQMRAGVGGRTVERSRADSTTAPSFSPKNNKHIRKWYLTAARSGMYLLDVARLRRLLESQRVRNSDVVIFDRYIYDQIANVDSPSLTARVYGKLILKQAPAPDLAFVLDASPTAAFARKPEYPLEFVHKNRRTFLRLRELVPQLIVIPGAPPEDVRGEIYFHISRSSLVRHASDEEKADVGMDKAVVPSQSSCSVRNEPTASV
jgi:thymidylate kinase